MEIFLKQFSRKGKKSQKLTAFISLVLFSFLSHSQVKEKDTTKVNQLDEILVSAVRVTKKTPVTFSDLNKKEIANRNLGQDIPILMNFLPSVVTTSDAGNGFGYTGIRVRGSDATRVNITINGIPYNDSESSGTYWVNMPDFASSLESLQLQRGVGTSTNGAGAFGASLNMLTNSYSEKTSGEIANSFGSFNSRKHTIKFSTGLMNNHSEKNAKQGFELAGRISNLRSDGYIDRASSNLKSYFMQGTYVGKTTLIKALVFGGTEKTYQSWNGIDSETIKTDRTYNSAGIFTDELGNLRFYDNETDNYQQDHYQLHWNEKISKHCNTNVAFHYTKGKGYFENYKEAAEFSDYGLKTDLTQVVTTTDLIVQKWLDNDFYGTTFSTNYKKEKLDFIFGCGWNKYLGDHFGKVIWARNASSSELGDTYYNDYGYKTDGNLFTKANYQLTKKWNLFADLQYRRVNYKANGVQESFLKETFHFFNPKTGLTYLLNTKNELYISLAVANREPNRTDYEGGNAKPEKLNDYELGWRYNSKKVKFTSNLYYMRYKDQLILTGNLDAVGNPIRSNSEKSYRLGLEIDATILLAKQLLVKPNITLSQNKNQDLNVNGTNFGNKEIAFSPSVIAGNSFVFEPSESLQIVWLSKFVGKQFMNNIEFSDAQLSDYFVNDLNVSYEYKTKSVFKSIVFSALINNIFDKEYISNGYMYDVYPYYYPQAGINFLAGVTLKL